MGGIIKGESYQIGNRATFTKTISESDVYMFAGITGDFNPAHIDKVEAEKGVFKERVAHGILVSGLISTVIGMKMPGPGTIYMEQDTKFLKPVKIGDTVTAVVDIAEMINEEKGIWKLKTEAYNQNHEKVITGYAVVKVNTEEKHYKERVSI